MTEATLNQTAFKRLSFVKWQISVLSICFMGLIILVIIKDNISAQVIDQNQIKQVWRNLTPIFATVDTESGYIAFANERDLRLKALDLTLDPPVSGTTLEEANNETPSPMVMFHQPDATLAREVPLSQLTLDIEQVKQSLHEAKDWSRINDEHSIEIVDLPNGETGIWIQVHHPLRVSKVFGIWNGLLYTVRDNNPVILLKLHNAQNLALKDINNDGYKDVIRILSNVFVNKESRSTFGIEKINWDVHAWDDQTGNFQAIESMTDEHIDSLAWGSFTAFLLLTLPFLSVAGLALFTNVSALTKLLGYYFYTFNLLFILISSEQLVIGIVWLALLFMTQISSRSMAHVLSTVHINNDTKLENQVILPPKSMGAQSLESSTSALFTLLTIVVGMTFLYTYYYIVLETGVPAEASLVVSILLVMVFWKYRRPTGFINGMFKCGMIIFSISMIICLMKWFG